MFELTNILTELVHVSERWKETFRDLSSVRD